MTGLDIKGYGKTEKFHRKSLHLLGKEKDIPIFRSIGISFFDSRERLHSGKKISVFPERATPSPSGVSHRNLTISFESAHSDINYFNFENDIKTFCFDSIYKHNYKYFHEQWHWHPLSL